MKLFLKKIFFVFLLPLLILCSILFYWDPFMVYFEYPSYNVHNPVAMNRDHLCLRMFEKKPYRRDVNSFIIGNSRSQAFRASDLERIYDSVFHTNINCFHFDGNGLGFYRMYNILKFIERLPNRIENVLLVIDHGSFDEKENSSLYLNKQPPELSGESYANYYLSFLKASMDPQFIAANIDFRLSGKYRDWFSSYIKEVKYHDSIIDVNGDMHWGYEKEIAEDSLAFYAKRMKEGIFYARSGKAVYSPDEISNKQKKQLEEIRAFFNLRKTNYQIIIAPMYDQMYFSKADRKILQDIFGTERVHDYSGINSITNSIGNYYEFSHFRPNVARQMMWEVYRGK